MKWLPAVVLLLSGTLAAPQQERGSIRGIVVSQEGEPASGLMVCPDWTDGRGVQGRLPRCARTDETGHFAISELPFDTYVLSASSEEEDYPEILEGGTWSLFDLYRKPDRPVVKLTQQEPAASVEMRLGPKAGVLLGDITDAVSGAPLKACAGFKDVSATDFNTAYPVMHRYIGFSCLPTPTSL